MPFIEAARTRIKQLPERDPARVVLEFMLKHATGIENSKSWYLIQAELKDHGIEMTQTQFQQTVLAETRAADIFIASTDHGRGRGYFLIKDHGDAMTMRNFYENRIAAEQANLANLNRLIDIQWPPAQTT